MNAALKDAAYSVVDTMLERCTVQETKKRIISVKAHTLHEMLYLWLEEIIFQIVTEGFAIHRIDATYHNAHYIRGTIYGEVLDIERHRFGVEIKAPTYHEMTISVSDNITMRFLMDL